MKRALLTRRIIMKSKLQINSISSTVNVIFNMFFSLACLVCVIPFILLVSVSFTEEKCLFLHGYKFIPGAVTLKAYEFLFKDFDFVLRAYGVTIIVVIIGATLNVLINSLYAYPLSRKDFPFKKLFSNYILITLLFSGGLAPTYYVYVRMLGIKNTIFAMILPGLTGGFNIFIMRTFYQQNIPFEVIESAKIDGASESRTFFSLVLPLSKPIIATIALFSTVYYWNDFFHCMMYIDQQKLYNLQYSMQRALMTIQYLRNNIEAMNQGAFFEQDIPSETVRMAMVVVGIGPIIFAYPFFQRYFIKGLTIGSVKG